MVRKANAQDNKDRISLKFAEPMDVALEFIESMFITDGERTLRRWAGEWWLWSDGKHATTAQDELMGSLWRWLSEHYSEITRGHVSNIVAALEAVTIIGMQDCPSMPYWLGNSSVPFPLAECLITRNSVLHLPSLLTGKVKSIPATPNLFAANCSPVAWTPRSALPVEWLKFLKSVWGDEQDAIATLQEWAGYLLTPDTSFQKMLLLIGPPRSGKGTITRILTAILGTGNVCGPTLASFAQNFGLWPLIGKPAAIINDARLSGRSDQAVVVERLLSISGEDSLTIDRKNLVPVTVRLPTRITMLSNEVPRLSDASTALANRFVCLRTHRSYLGKEDIELEQRLLKELPGILNWAIEGWQRLRQRGRFEQPECGRELHQQMVDAASPVQRFVRECCVIDSDARVEKSALFQAWRDWCKGNGHRENDESTFGRNLHAALSDIGDSRPRAFGMRVYHYTGIRLDESGPGGPPVF